MLKTLQAIQKEKLINIKELQKSPSRYLRGITRIIRGKDTLGYFLDKKSFDDLLEDLEALRSKAYMQSIEKARKRKEYYSLDDVEALYETK